MTGGKGGKSFWTSLQSLSERFENGKKKINLWKSRKWASCQPESINYSSHLKQRASAPTPRCPRALQLRNQRELSYRNQDLIKDLTAGQLSLLWSDPTFRFNRCINCAFTQQNCTLVRSLPTSERSRFLPVSAWKSSVWRTARGGRYSSKTKDNFEFALLPLTPVLGCPRLAAFWISGFRRIYLCVCW